MPRHRRKIIDIGSAIAILFLIALDGILWKDIFLSTSRATVSASVDFLPVTQGQSALFFAPGGETILTDAGADATIVDDLQKALPANSGSYIDLAVISSPYPANYEGYQYLLQHYRVGAFVYNGRADGDYKSEWQQLMSAITARHIPIITVEMGDRIRIGAGANIEILSPRKEFARSPDIADTAIVQRITTPTFTALLAAGISGNVEAAFLSSGSSSSQSDIRADILQGPFAGIGVSSTDPFIQAVAPEKIIIEPGIKGGMSISAKTIIAHLASSTHTNAVTAGHGQFLLYNK